MIEKHLVHRYPFDGNRFRGTEFFTQCERGLQAAVALKREEAAVFFDF